MTDQPTTRFVLPGRFVALILEEIIGTTKHLIWHGVIVVATLAYAFMGLPHYVFANHFWGELVPLVWVLALLVVWHSVRASIALVASDRRDQVTVETDGLLYVNDSTKFKVKTERPQALPSFLRSKVWGIASVPIALSLFVSVMVWSLADRPVDLRSKVAHLSRQLRQMQQDSDAAQEATRNRYERMQKAVTTRDRSELDRLFNEERADFEAHRRAIMNRFAVVRPEVILTERELLAILPPQEKSHSILDNAALSVSRSLIDTGSPAGPEPFLQLANYLDFLAAQLHD